MNSYKILVLEEEIVVAEDIKISLQNAGYKVERTSSPSDAFGKTSTINPDLVIIGEVSKEGLNEVQAAVRIESLCPNPLKFIFLVSKPITVVGIVSSYRVVQKPFTEEELLQIVKEQLQS